MKLPSLLGLRTPPEAPEEAPHLAVPYPTLETPPPPPAAARPSPPEAWAPEVADPVDGDSSVTDVRWLRAVEGWAPEVAGSVEGDSSVTDMGWLRADEGRLAEDEASEAGDESPPETIERRQRDAQAVPDWGPGTSYRQNDMYVPLSALMLEPFRRVPYRFLLIVATVAILSSAIAWLAWATWGDEKTSNGRLLVVAIIGIGAVAGWAAADLERAYRSRSRFYG